MESEIQDSFINSQHLTMISLDIEKAYDMTWRTRILQILLRHKITGNMFCFVQHFLNQRTIRVRANGVTSKQVTIDNGVPQGSIFSVTLFLLAITDILNNISLPVKGFLFADDLIIFCKGNNTLTTEALLQDTINKIQSWATKTGFKFSQNKSQCIYFSRRSNNQYNPNIYLNQKRIEVVNHIKLLGLIFDQKLSWRLQTETLKGDLIYSEQ